MIYVSLFFQTYFQTIHCLVWICSRSRVTDPVVERGNSHGMIRFLVVQKSLILNVILQIGSANLKRARDREYDNRLTNR